MCIVYEQRLTFPSKQCTADMGTTQNKTYKLTRVFKDSLNFISLKQALITLFT